MLQVRDGHHRLAAAAARGERTARVYLKTRPTQTAMQRLLLQVEMTKQRPELYQPLNLPELGAGWPLWRRCDDRWEMMLKFMGERGILPPGGGGEARTACDIACSYGWFVARYREAGFRARGIDVDPAAVKVGHICYGNTPQETGAQDAVAFLRAVQKPYDVMSCFSLAHHFVLGRGPCSAEELLRLLDKATGRVLFFDSGQNHERWFKDKLPEWDVEKLDRWLRETTSFREVVRLGVDRDDVGVGEGNYRRMLFALIR